MVNCLHCRRKLAKAPHWSETWGGTGYGYNGNGYFCSLRCGYRWAVAVAELGEGKQARQSR